ncbi:MAG TPA: replication initiation protein, partial [Beutenbergiaceae bacterium]|nr:replication initiation protein [Beutenbergiaceae bacterium]
MADTTTRWEQLWLPLWPLSSDDLRTGIYRGSRQTALKRRYIEANPQAISNLLVVDIDKEDALLRSIWDRDKWRPNAVVENPANGHAHAVWALEEPITRTEYARAKPLAYAAAITEGLRRSVDGDKSYSGLITKNPEHDHWNATWWTETLYTLPQLEEHLTGNDFMPPRSWRRTRRKNPIGL